MTTWTISKNGGAAQTLATWGISSTRLTLQSQAASSLEFVADGVRIDATKPFAYGDRVELFSNSVRRFYGKVRFIYPSAAPEREGVRYLVMDPWFDLENVPYQQANWHWYDNTGTYRSGYSVRVNLFQDANGNPVTVKAQIEDILTYARTVVSPSIPINTGTIEPTMNWAYTREDNVSCANAIRYCLRAAPDCTAYFDYSGSGSPTLHIRRRSSLSSVTLNATAGTSVVASDIKPRYDLRKTHVQITFEYSNTWNNQSFATRSYDVYPAGTTGQEADCFAAILSLAGSSVTVESQTIETDTIDATSPAWWYKYYKALQEEHAGTIFIADGVVYQLVDDVNDPNYGKPDTSGGNFVAVDFTKHVVKGAVPAWTPTRGRRYVAQAWCQYSVLDDSGNPIIDPETGEGVLRQGIISLNITGTDYASGTYQNATTNSFAETAPSGIAQYLYTALNALHYDGRVTIAENEVSFVAGLRNSINLTGGDPTWSAMSAQVQVVEYDIDFGVTAITLGPPEHLSPQDLMEQFRATRERIYTFNPATRVNAAPEAASSIYGTFHADNESASNANSFEQIVCSSGDADVFTKVSPSHFYATKKVAGVTTEIFASADSKNLVLRNGTTTIGANVETGILSLEKGSKAIAIDINDLGSGQTAQFRETDVCENGVAKKTMILRTGTYT